MTEWTDKPGYLTISETADATGATIPCLRVWETRYGWPRSTRSTKNGYRLYAPEVVAEIKRFMKAGRPTNQLACGYWTPIAEPRERKSSVDLTGHTEHVESRLVDAASRGDRSLVAFYLASLGRMRPRERAAAVACVQCASGQLNGQYDDLLEQFAQIDSTRTLNNSSAKQQAVIP